MGTILSSKVTVFPSARRGAKYPESRQMSEQAFASIVNRLVEYPEFIIEAPYDENDETMVVISTLPISFNIKGYYFRIPQTSDLLEALGTTSSTGVYAWIRIIKSGTYTEIWGQDIEEAGKETYQGLVIQDHVPSEAEKADGWTYIQLFTRAEATGSPWRIYPSSLFRFSAKTIKFEIDGGTFGE